MLVINSSRCFLSSQYLSLLGLRSDGQDCSSELCAAGIRCSGIHQTSVLGALIEDQLFRPDQSAGRNLQNKCFSHTSSQSRLVCISVHTTGESTDNKAFFIRDILFDLPWCKIFSKINLPHANSSIIKIKYRWNIRLAHHSTAAVLRWIPQNLSI